MGYWVNAQMSDYVVFVYWIMSMDRVLTELFPIWSFCHVGLGSL